MIDLDNCSSWSDLVATHEPAAVYLLCLDAACVAAGKGLPTTKRLGVGRGGI